MNIPIELNCKELELVETSTPSLTCAYCGGIAQGNYSIHRDWFCEGPEVDLCDECGSGRLPTCPEIWRKISREYDRGTD